MADDNKNDQGDPRVYFAAERTLLAWVRTGLAMMGFGFVVARFGFFLRELAAQHSEVPPQRFGLSLWIGITLVILGVVVPSAPPSTAGESCSGSSGAKRFGSARSRYGCCCTSKPAGCIDGDLPAPWL